MGPGPHQKPFEICNDLYCIYIYIYMNTGMPIGFEVREFDQNIFIYDDDCCVWIWKSNVLTAGYFKSNIWNNQLDPIANA